MIEKRLGTTTLRWALSCAAALIFLPATAPAATPCPNEAVRAEQGMTGLPDCMGLELVSPPKKFVQPAFAPTFSPDGERIRFRSLAALAGTPGLQMPFGDSYIATHTVGGWSTAFTSPPVEADIGRGGEPSGGPYAYEPDFSRWLSFGVNWTEMQAGLLQLFAGGLDGSFAPITPLLVPIDDSGNPNIVFLAGNMQSMGSSLDLSTTVFRTKVSSTSFLAGDPRTNVLNEPGGDVNNYLVDRDGGSEPSLELLGRGKDDVVYGGRCGTRLGGGIVTTRGTGRLNQGAISADGERIFFSTRPAQDEGVACDPEENPLRIMKRTQTPAGPVIEELIEGDDPEEAGDDLYQGASLDGAKVYFTSTRALVGGDGDSGTQCSRNPGASKGCDLYLYDSSLPEGSRLVQVSAGEPGSPTPGSGAEVLSSITAISTDGTHAYFAAEGVLTTDTNPEGASAVAEAPNLYAYETEGGDLAFIGTLADADEGSTGESGLWGTEQSFLGDAAAVPMHSSAAGGEGHVLVFGSKAPLSSEDTDGGFRDLFRYETQAGTLQLLSKPAEGASGEPKADVEMNPTAEGDSPERPRWVSEDGLTVAFNTAEALVAGDEDGAADPYFFKEGKVNHLPGDEQVPTLSEDGSQVGFTTPLALVPFDGDTATDVYVARSGGGFTPPVAVPPCDPLGGGCQGPAAPPPAFVALESRVLVPSENVKPKKPKAKNKKAKGKNKRGKKKKDGKKGRAGK